MVIFAFFFTPPPHRFSPMGFGFFGEGEEEAAGHLVKGGVAWAFHPDNNTLVAMDTGNGAHLRPPRVGDVGDGPDDWVLSTVAHLEGWGDGFGRRGLACVCVLLGSGVAFVLGVGWWVFCFWCHPVGWRRHLSPRMTRNKICCSSSGGGGGGGGLGLWVWWWPAGGLNWSGVDPPLSSSLRGGGGVGCGRGTRHPSPPPPRAVWSF